MIFCSVDRAVALASARAAVEVRGSWDSWTEADMVSGMVGEEGCEGMSSSAAIGGVEAIVAEGVWAWPRGWGWNSGRKDEAWYWILGVGCVFIGQS